MGVQSAGAVVLEEIDGRLSVLLVHRPKYDDWSFPKGKLEPGEPAPVAAVREVLEETGLAVVLGPPLASQTYPISGGRSKTVSYWLGRVTGGGGRRLDVAGHTYGDEIDGVTWVPVEDAPGRMSYDYDRATLAEALAMALSVPRDSVPLLVLRHGQAHPRKRWREDDRLRPLAPAGRRESLALVPLLAAYGVSEVVTSPSVRCVETVLPYAGAARLSLREEPVLSEEDASPGGVRSLVDSVVDGLAAGRRGPVVLCTHRPVLPHLLTALGLPAPHPKLAPAAVLAAHLTPTTPSLLASELHPAPMAG